MRLLAVLVLATAGTDGDLPHYRDVAAEAGMIEANVFGSSPKKFITETTGSGAAFLDYDLDGDMDVYLVNGRTREQHEKGETGPPDRLYRNVGGTGFVEVAGLAGVAETGWGGGAAAADYDNDGDPDLLVTNIGGRTFYRNNGDGTFTDRTNEAGLEDDRWSASAAFGDIDGDGFLDLYVTHYISWDPRLLDGLNVDFCRYRNVPVLCGPRGLPGEADALFLNQRDRTFRDVTRSAGVENGEGRGLGVAFFDFDDDGDEDIFVANDSTANFLYRNDGSGRFEDLALLAGVAYSAFGNEQSGMGADAGDYDEDGKPDLVVTNFQGDYNALRRNLGTGVFADVSHAAGVAASSLDRLGWGVKLADCNNDGYLDLFVVNGHIYPEIDAAGIGESYAQRAQVLLNVDFGPARKFEDVSARAGPALETPRPSRGLAAGDFDDDGDMDFVANNMNELPALFRDDASHRNGWVRLALIGRSVNRDAMGARIAYEAGGRRHHRRAGSLWSYLSTSDPRLLLGLGSSAGAEGVEIRFRKRETPLALGSIGSGEDVVVLEGAGRVR